MNNNDQQKTPHFLTPLLAATAFLALPATAQQQPTLDEIVVTAEHREASLQDTQISLSAFGADDIEQLGISNGVDLGEHIPNLNAQPYVGGRSGVSFNIRGVGNAETLISFDPAVSVYIDGVLIAKNTGSLLDILELERVEVLRGPQGTLYGRNTMGGAVNYITRKPGDEFEASVKATVGNYDQKDLRGMINAPLLDQDSGIGALSLRASVATLNRDGIQDNDFAGAPQDELGTVDRDVALMHLNWQPTDTLSAIYSYDRTRIDEIPETPWVTKVNPAGPTAFLAAYKADEEDERPDSIQSNERHIAEVDVDGHSLNVTWDITDTMSLHALTGYREMENRSQSDADGSPLPLLRTRDRQEFESLSQEFRLLGTAFNDRMDYSVGVFYFEEEGDLFSETLALASSGLVAQVNIADYSNEALAVYGQTTFAITDKLDLTGGVRYTREDREMAKAFTVGISYPEPIFLDDVKADPTLSNFLFPKASKDFDNVSPMISLAYHWTDESMTYFKVSSGYQSGGFNSRDLAEDDFVTGFDEETLIAYELGLKARFAGRYQLNGALFFSDYDDKRVNQFNPETLASVQRNAGVVEIWGLELELLAQLTDQLQVGFNYGHIDPEYEEYEVVEPRDDDDDGVTDRLVTVDKTGVSNFPYTPENSYSAFLVHEYPLGLGTLRTRLDWNYRDEMTFLVPQPERNSSGTTQRVNARVTLDEITGPGDSQMSVSLWGKNLTDEGYWTYGVNIYDSFGFDHNTYGEPRTYGLDLAVRF